MITLYIKRHNKTGLMYLGKTNKKDPHRYRGSGKRWLQEIKEHGADYSTTILEQVTLDNLYERGRFWSLYYRVTTAMDDYGNHIWANLIPETGGGPGTKHSKETYERIGNQSKGKLKKGLSRSIKLSWEKETRKILQHSATSGENHYSKKPGYVNKKKGKKYPNTNPKLSGDNNPSKRPEVREKMKKPHGPKLSIRGESHYTKKSGFTSKTSGLNHYTKSSNFSIKTDNKNYDHQIYEWQNEETGEIVQMNRRDFIKYTGANPSVVCEIINKSRGKTRTKKWKYHGPV